jgi:hypothetical protein
MVYFGETSEYVKSKIQEVNTINEEFELNRKDIYKVYIVENEILTQIIIKNYNEFTYEIKQKDEELEPLLNITIGYTENLKDFSDLVDFFNYRYEQEHVGKQIKNVQYTYNGDFLNMFDVLDIIKAIKNMEEVENFQDPFNNTVKQAEVTENYNERE